MRRNAAELSILREECRNAKSVDDLKQILDVVLEQLCAVERDYSLRRIRDWQQRR
jgi:hypothetical protein